MKKYIIAVATIFMAIFAAQAEEIRMVYSLLINTQSGETIEYEFAKEPRATFQGNDMLISLGDRLDVAIYPMADVKNITFESKQDLTGIDEVTGGGERMVVRITDTEVAIAGLTPGSPVSIYTTAGTLIASAEANSEGSVSFATAGLSLGVYVVTIPGHSFKFIK